DGETTSAVPGLDEPLERRRHDRMPPSRLLASWRVYQAGRSARRRRSLTSATRVRLDFPLGSESTDETLFAAATRQSSLTLSHARTRPQCRRSSGVRPAP